MTTQLATANFQQSFLDTIGSLTISNVYITDSNYTILNDTAISTSGGYIKIIGTCV